MKGTREKRWLKIRSTDRFSLFQNAEDEDLFEISWRKLKGYGRRRIRADSVQAAAAKAPDIIGYGSAEKGFADMTMLEAFTLALENTNRGHKSKRDWLYSVERFMRWLAEHYSHCTHWEKLRRPMLREYLRTFAGKSATTKRLAFQPICQTSGFMSREYGGRDIATRLGIGAKLKQAPAEVYLPDVIGFLDFVREGRPWLEAGAALQGLAGLQLQEATRLTWDRVDLDHGLIEISGEVKNAYRRRVIPVVGRVVEALRRAHARRAKNLASSVVTIEHSVVTTQTGLPYGDWWHNYSKEMTREIRAWNPALGWKPKDLRNCLPTYAAMEGLLNDVWEQYLGHAPRSVTARHYIPRLASVSLGEAEALEKHLDCFRNLVLEPLESSIDRRPHVQILNGF